MTDLQALDALVAGIRERDDAAFAELHGRIANDLFAFALSIVRDRRFAEDAVQQAFLELVRAAPEFRGDGRSLRSWMFRSVRFSCLDEIRRQGRRPEFPTADLPDRPDGDVQQPELGLDPSLEAAWSVLDERDRELLFLRHVVGLSGAEIASATSLNRAAAYAATKRAERRLEAELSDVESSGDAASYPVERRDSRGNENGR